MQANSDHLEVLIVRNGRDKDGICVYEGQRLELPLNIANDLLIRCIASLGKVSGSYAAVKAKKPTYEMAHANA